VLEAAVGNALESSPYRAVRRLACRVVGARVVISGDVPSFHAKQLALSLVSGIVDPAAIDDDIRVGLR
jgi:hypothetical protein